MTKVMNTILTLAFAAVMMLGFTMSAQAYTYTSTLSAGSNGSQVIELQSALNMAGANPVLDVDGNFGPNTIAGLKAFQTANGLEADGIAGPNTGAVLAGSATVVVAGDLCPNGMTLASNCTEAPAGNTPAEDLCPNGMTLASNCTDAPGESTTPSDFEGTEGSVDSFTVGSAKETDVSEDQENVELFVLDIELSDDGDLMLNRLDLYMGEDLAGSESSKPWDYFSEIAVTVDGEEVARENTDSSSDWSEYDTGTLTTTNQEYRLRFSGIDAALASDETTEVGFLFTTLNNIDSDDESADWEIGTTSSSFRFVDGTGFTFTDGFDLDDEFSFDTEETASLDIAAASEDPEAVVIEVDDSTATNGVVIGVFEIEEGDDVNVNISEMVATLATTGTGTVANIVKKAYLSTSEDVDNKFAEESVTGTTVTFDNIDFDISGDEIVTVYVIVDLDDTNDGARYAEGDTLQVTAINLTEYTDANGNDDGDFTETGSFLGDAHELRTEGIMVDVKSATTDVTSVDLADNDIVQFSWTLDITAFGDNAVYINRDVAQILTANSATEVNVLYGVDNTGTALGSVSATMTESDTDVTEVTGDDTAYGTEYNSDLLYKIAKGSTGTVTINISGTNAGESKQIRAYLADIQWTSDSVEAATSKDGSVADMNNYTFQLEEDSRTPYKIVN
ncbi:MAG: hypothetical protein ACI9AR_000038 [Flavobacteriaceae bacterium]|jgi:hypothetical protein